VYLLAGLGNPGTQYQHHRHNVGFMLVDRLAAGSGDAFTRTLKRSLTCQLRRRNEALVLAKPLTFMNLSGGAVLELLHYFSLDLDHLLVAYDDFALPLGKIRLRASGSSGGHRGMESIISALGTEQVPRLRLGVGDDRAPGDYRDYVLSDFPKRQREEVETMLDNAVAAVDTWLTQGIGIAMSRHNG